MKNKTHKPRGFAALNPEKLREIASMGGKTAHKVGTAHEFTSKEAREAGRKGGYAVSRDREHMRKIGLIGRRAATAKRETHS